MDTGKEKKKVGRKPSEGPRAADFGDQMIQVTQVATMFGKSIGWIKQLQHRGLLRTHQKGKRVEYRIKEVVEDYIKHIAGAPTESDGPTKSDHDREIARIRMEKSQLELDEKRMNLHSSEDVQKIMGDMIYSAKAKLVAIPSRVSASLAGESEEVIRVKLEQEVTAALISLTEYSPTLFSEKVGEDDEAEDD